MKKSINIGAVPAAWPLKEKLQAIKKAGFEAVELNLAEEGFLSLTSSQEEILAVRQQVNQAGLEIASLLAGGFWRHPLTSSDQTTRSQGENLLKKAIEICSWLGTEALLVVPGVVGPEPQTGLVTGYDEAYQRSQECLRRAAAFAEKSRVYLCVENVWNRFLLSPLEMKRYVEEIGSPYVQVYFDVGNVLLFGFPEMWIRILGKLIRRIHLKDFKTGVGTGYGFCTLLEGDVNWPEVLKALQEVGYDSYLTAEVGPYRYYPETVLLHTSTSMDRIMGR
ncbi:MAG TPA: sugar phosphate isomerase/epimerase family protein [bacterium]|nr:sugar phosphate isomerase/epimerase family protein [bacterium]HOL66689.1 sugar phosphate isomerase/epimerase family protein [bacterium]HPP11364.1 sugar phosphate isomerase/epimerase family protein [bacterium]